MTIEVDPDWWKSLFDEVYLLTDARSVDDDRVTRQEIDLYTALVPLHSRDRILDLCGGHGRHSMELYSRGFVDCTVLDYSRSLIEIGKAKSAEKGYAISFIQADARHTTLESAAFDHVLILGNSLGYIADPDADLLILKECGRLLKPRGCLLLDVTDGKSVRKNISPQAWHQIGDDIVVCRQREVRKGIISAREMVLSKSRGMIRDKTYRIRLYGEDDLVALARSAGFDDIRVHGNTSAIKSTGDVGCMNHRLVITAHKPQ